jgi:hypothetical protein
MSYFMNAIVERLTEEFKREAPCHGPDAWLMSEVAIARPKSTVKTLTRGPHAPRDHQEARQ